MPGQLSLKYWFIFTKIAKDWWIMVGSVSLVDIGPYTPFRDNFIIIG